MDCVQQAGLRPLRFAVAVAVAVAVVFGFGVAVGFGAAVEFGVGFGFEVGRTGGQASRSNHPAAHLDLLRYHPVGAFDRGLEATMTTRGDPYVSDYARGCLDGRETKGLLNRARTALLPARCVRASIALSLLLVATAGGSCSSSSHEGTSDDASVFGTGPIVDPGDAPSEGPASAKVVVVEFADFECPSSGYEEPTLKQMLHDYSGRVRFVFKEFPLNSIHPYAEAAAEAALAANAQGQFWPYHDLLFANQTALERLDLDSYASSLGLDMPEFDAALNQGTYAAAVAADVAQGESLHVHATPTFFVNDTKLVGAVAYSTLKSVIDQQLDSN